MTSYFVLAHDTARQRAQEAVKSAPQGYVVRVCEPTRTNEQNALLWPLLDCISKQVNWYGNKLSQDEWKDVFTASLKKQKVVPSIDGGGFVMCGQSTRVMGKRQFSDLVELIYAFGAQQKPPVNFGEAV